ncbi:hypothetical protein C8Q75DRAFT_732698 [Abortiporus biennis]|nr:hypothetical protein C8Q75DRAFT_732698 [Abortiporus biennis]
MITLPGSHANSRIQHLTAYVTENCFHTRGPEEKLFYVQYYFIRQIAVRSGTCSSKEGSILNIDGDPSVSDVYLLILLRIVDARCSVIRWEAFKKDNSSTSITVAKVQKGTTIFLVEVLWRTLAVKCFPNRNYHWNPTGDPEVRSKPDMHKSYS